MSDNGEQLQSVIDHATGPDLVDYDDIAPTVEALAISGDVGLIPRLNVALDQFLDDENFYGRDLIASVLAGVAGLAALPALLLAADRDIGDDQDGLQSEIAELQDQDPATARELILELISSDQPQRHRAGLMALGTIAEVGDVALLARAACHQDSDVRLMAVESVVDATADDQAFEILAGALRDGDEQVRMAAVSRLGASGRHDAMDALADVVTDDNPRVRSRLAYALGRLGGPSATSQLDRLLQDREPQVRDKARDALGAVGDPAAIGILLTEATAPDAQVRGKAAKALAQAVDADPRVEQQLTQLASDNEPTVRAATLSGLASATGQSTRWATLAAALANDPDKSVCQRVALVVQHLAPDDAHTILRRLAEDTDATVRQTAATQLTRLPDRMT